MADELIVFDDVVKRYRLGTERSNLKAANPWRRFDPGQSANTVTALDHMTSRSARARLSGSSATTAPASRPSSS